VDRPSDPGSDRSTVGPADTSCDGGSVDDDVWDAAPRVVLRDPTDRGGGLDERLGRFAADARVDEAVRTRSRERWLRRQAEEESTVVGVLADLRDAATTVEVHTRGGGLHRAVVRSVGVDHVVLADVHGRGEIVVTLSALASVRTAPGVAPVLGDRVAAGTAHLADVLAVLAERRTEVRVVTRAGDVAAGAVRSVGDDVLVIGSRDASPAVAYVPLTAISEVVVEG
jgi:hypothetical protein